MEPLLSATAIVKRFGRTLALDDVSIDLHAGEIHAIVGENGAGKSTLARILAGVAAADHGRVMRPGSSRGARLSERPTGEVVYAPQRPALVPELTLVDNFLLGDSGWWAARRSARARLVRASKSLGTDLPLDTPTAALDVVQRQLGALALALAGGARVLLLDEPTSTLGPVQVEGLQRVLQRLAATGAAVAIITHRIAEVLGGTERMTVLREGRVVHRSATAGVTAQALGEWMVGTRTTTTTPPPATSGGPLRLRVRGIGLGGRQAAALDTIDLDVRGGERVGIAGVGGAGQAMFADVLAGLVRPARGTVRVDGVDVTGDARKTRAAGLAFIPEDRAAGLSLSHSVAENLALFKLASLRGRFLHGRDRDAEARHAATIVSNMAIVPADVSAPVASLSGGNQQKVLLGRELEDAAAVIVAHGPTRGLDLAAAATVRNVLFDAAARGAALIVLSSDLDELFALCDRLLVLSGGRLVAEFDCRDGPPNAGDLGRALAGDPSFHPARSAAAPAPLRAHSSTPGAP